MRINTINLDEEHWTTDYIPISYNKILTQNQYNKSITFYWNTDYNLHAICRGYYITKNRIEIGDVWLNDDLRGKKINEVKISVLFMRKVISKIWNLFKDASEISLLVHKENISAIKLYEKLNFEVKKDNINNKELNIKNGLLMIRTKRN